MFALSNAIGPCTRSSNVVCPGRHHEPDGPRRARRFELGDLVRGLSAQQVRS